MKRGLASLHLRDMEDVIGDPPLMEETDVDRVEDGLLGMKEAVYLLDRGGDERVYLIWREGGGDGVDDAADTCLLLEQMVEVVDDAVEGVANLVADHVDKGELLALVKLGLAGALGVGIGGHLECRKLLLDEDLPLGQVRERTDEGVRWDAIVATAVVCVGKGLHVEPEREPVVWPDEAELARHCEHGVCTRLPPKCLHRAAFLWVNVVHPRVDVISSLRVQSADGQPPVACVRDTTLCIEKRVFSFLFLSLNARYYRRGILPMA